MVCILISVVGGRIISAFTSNWLRAQPGPQTEVAPGFNRFDQVVILSTVVLAVSWTLFPNHIVTGILAMATGLLQMARVSRWKGHLTLSEPLLLALHVAYGWLGVGFVLLAFNNLTGDFLSAGMHALSIGAMSGLILAVSSRAAPGHTNRPLVAGYALSSVFLLINAAAVARVFAAIADPGLVRVSAIIWVLAFLLFAFRFVPVLFGPAKR